MKVKSALISILFLFSTSSCSWLAAHPQVETDLETEAVDILKDSEKVIEDVVIPSEKVAT